MDQSQIITENTMAIPNENTALDEYFDDLLFTGAYLSGSRGLAPLGKKVLAARKKVQEAVAMRNDANDEWMLAHVAQVVAWDALKEPLESLERHADAHFDRDRKGLRDVFKGSVPALLRTTQPNRVDALRSVVEFVAKAHTGKLGVAAKEFREAWEQYQEAAKTEASADEKLTKAVAAVAEAKRRGVVAMRETDGSLRTTFAEQPGQARKFFRNKGGKAQGDGAPQGRRGGSSPSAPEEETPAGDTPIG